LHLRSNYGWSLQFLGDNRCNLETAFVAPNASTGVQNGNLLTSPKARHDDKWQKRDLNQTQPAGTRPILGKRNLGMVSCSLANAPWKSVLALVGYVRLKASTLEYHLSREAFLLVASEVAPAFRQRESCP
jgi:hypothetical protein